MPEINATACEATCNRLRWQLQAVALAIAPSCVFLNVYQWRFFLMSRCQLCVCVIECFLIRTKKWAAEISAAHTFKLIYQNGFYFAIYFLPFIM